MRKRLTALLALSGMLCALFMGGLREALDVPTLPGVSVEKMAAENGSEESAPADKAQASTMMEVGPLAVLAIEVVPPPASEAVSCSALLIDKCRPGYGRRIEHPPRASL